MNTFEQVYEAALAVPVGTTVNGKWIDLPPEKPSCVNFLVTYTLGVAGRTLTVALELANKAHSVILAPLGTSSQPLSASAAVQVSIPGGPSAFRLTFASAGAAGADDSVAVIAQGLPTGTVIS